jgi:CubicO group peptidase (beta-lactamase class C family)
MGDTKKLQKISEFTDSYIEQGDLAGTVTLIVRQGDVVHLESKGVMNLETRQPMREDTIFRIYSMTKPITSVAAMMLYEQGKFDLNTPISNFIPEFRDTKVFSGGTATNYETVSPHREITMGDLLSHTSGLTYDFMYASHVDEMYRNAKISVFNPQIPLDELVKTIAGMPLLFSPGTKWNYSHSTDILGRIIEVISGQSLDVFLKKEIFDPLDMVDTDFYVPQEKQDRFSANYLRSKNTSNETLILYDDPKTGQYSKAPISFLGGSGLVSTVCDYLKFASMLLNKGRSGDKQLLKPETVELMTTNYLPGDIHDFSYCVNEDYILKGTGMGLGFGITLDPDLEQIPGNPGTFGWSGAAHTVFFVDPKEELIAIFLTQLFPADYKLEMMAEFRKAVYESIGSTGV